jgi:hypothetical protein
MNGNTAVFRIAAWLSFCGLYLLLVGKTDLSELIAGGASATVTLLLVRLLREKFKRPLLVKVSWSLLLWRIHVAMVTESFQLLAALVRQVLGREVDGLFIEHELTAPEDNHDQARRAYMTFGVCITPNSYLVFYDRENKRALIRQLVGEKLSTVDRLFVELP